MKANKKLVMIPGPTPVLRSIQNEMGRETASFKDPAFIQDFKDVIKDLKDLWRTTGEVFVVAGSGTLAMEIAIANTLKKGDNILCVSHGYFGDRMVELCERKGLSIDVLQSQWGEAVPVADIEKKLQEKKYQAVAITHVDTSTGVRSPVEEISEVLKKDEDTLFILDGVCSTAGHAEYIDDMGIDILLTASQKAFGVPPGLAIVWASKKALKRREELGTIAEYYVDFKKWQPVMEDPDKYFGTPPVNLIYAMKESLRYIKEEGMEKRYARHKKMGEAVQAAIESLGFTVLAKESCRAATLSNIIYPKGINDGEFRNVLEEEGIVVAGGLGAYAGKMFRLGHMGNIDANDLVAVMGAIERTLFRLGVDVKFGKSVGVLLEILMKGESV